MEKDIFLKALWLQSPWCIKEFALSVESQRLDIYVDFEKWAKFENNDGDMVTAEQTEQKTWKHLFFWQYPTYLHVRVPKLKDSSWKVQMISLPWAREGSGFTLLFESIILELAKHMPLSKLAEHVAENDERLMRIITHYTEKSKEKADYSGITKWWIDETSRKKGHNYITTFINFETKKVSCIVEWKWKESVEAIAKDIEAHKGNRNNILEVSMDFSPSFTAGVMESFPKASIIYDRFHFMQFLWKAMNETRILELKNNDFLKGSKYLWLQNPETLSDEKKAKLEELKTNNRGLAEAYQMKENIKEFFEKETKEQAELFLQYWCEWVMNSDIEPMKKVVKTIKAHWQWIMNYIEKKVNNGIVEGINSIIQTIKRRARGYKNVKNFMAMIYLKLWDFSICQEA